MRPRWQLREAPVVKRRVLAVLGLLALAWQGGCQRGAGTPVAEPRPADSTPLEQPPPIDHGAPPPYAGTWRGPTLRLRFAGPWVLVEPLDATDPASPEPAQPNPASAQPTVSAQPGPTLRDSPPLLELRASVERHAGDAFALRTSVAGIMPSDFLRPTDWTLLVEGDALAIAMGDEPLQTYRHEDAPPPLVGPSLLHEQPLPETLPFTAAAACLELASLTCAEIETDAPPAAGCREALWSACVGHVLDGDATAGAATGSTTGSSGRLVIRLHRASSRFFAGLAAGAPEDRLEAAQGLETRALELAASALNERLAAGELPLDDPALPELLARIRHGIGGAALAPPLRDILE
ncbi:hypothetical protein G6O69_24125 [Pseudenhygromyxa sp. WMMC2535]|uniref:hypothetical protein n=1 Tax=Pseudenhygromyxa sp. WMMC2535 TaxID=2712867 RepID=UPI0015952AE5|nr:hypothetical protein [Pseudenhygromyxa sp. WMMC2535]NVB40949.1 hypothetical protein [Pseudenhygromyxa sp. WMMC2535]